LVKLSNRNRRFADANGSVSRARGQSFAIHGRLVEACNTKNQPWNLFRYWAQG
jgi:hypothetical protein